MPGSRNDIIQRLKREILPLQGFRPPTAGRAVRFGLGPVEEAFPNRTFPTGAIHEFISNAAEGAAASGGFLAGLLAPLMAKGGACLWISSGRKLFPPGLAIYGVPADRIIFVDLQREKDVLWAMEESLKCEGLAAVVGELKELSFTDSRRLQLAVEQSRVTGFVLRHNPRSLGTVAAVTRWQIEPIPSVVEGDMPGIGFPRWNVPLLKVRNGRPGVWQLEWSAGRFQPLPQPMTRRVPALALAPEEKRQTG